MKTLSAAALLLAALLLWPRPADPLPGFPYVFLWAWERPENLEFLDPHATGVAFLARTVCLRGGAVSALGVLVIEKGRTERLHLRCHFPRMPRMHGRPPHWFGLKVIRSAYFMGTLYSL